MITKTTRLYPWFLIVIAAKDSKPCFFFSVFPIDIRFSSVFRGHKMGKIAKNGLKICPVTRF